MTSHILCVNMLAPSTSWLTASVLERLPFPVPNMGILLQSEDSPLLDRIRPVVSDLVCDAAAPGGRVTPTVVQRVLREGSEQVWAVVELARRIEDIRGRAAQTVSVYYRGTARRSADRRRCWVLLTGLLPCFGPLTPKYAAYPGDAPPERGRPVGGPIHGRGVPTHAPSV